MVEQLEGMAVARMPRPASSSSVTRLCRFHQSGQIERDDAQALEINRGLELLPVLHWQAGEPVYRLHEEQVTLARIFEQTQQLGSAAETPLAFSTYTLAMTFPARRCLHEYKIFPPCLHGDGTMPYP